MANSVERQGTDQWGEGLPGTRQIDHKAQLHFKGLFSPEPIMQDMLSSFWP
jgi:hypothetical protein